MNRKVRQVILVLTVTIGLVVLVNVFGAVTATNTVPTTLADKDSFGLGANEVKPGQCAGMGLTNVVDFGAGQNGTAQNDLVLGTAAADIVMQGAGGDDCMLGGAGDERWWFIIWWPGIVGGDGDDVLIGGPGNDVCFGGAGNNTYYGCETIY